MLVGAMKSGTTFLYDCLAQHPEICPAEIKEPQYFAKYLSAPEDVTGNYERLFDVDPNKHRYTLDGSGVYTHLPAEKGVAERMYDYGLRPKIIYTVRHPVDRIESHYNYMRHRYASWKREIDDPFLVSVSSYHRQLQPYAAAFGRDNILLVDFEYLRNDPQAVCDQVFKFLGASACKIDTGASKVHATKNIAPALRHPVRYLKKPLRLLPRAWVIAVRKWLEVRLPAPSVKLTPEQRQLSKHRLQEDMQLLKRDYGFDIGRWGF